MSESVRCFLVERVEQQDGPPLFRRADTGEPLGLQRDLPAGAIWKAPWMGDAYAVNGKGPVLVVKLPNGRDWMPGETARNCPQKGVDHDCWCVHGRAPRLTVDKTPVRGRSTCAAGSGSIGSGRGAEYWHGQFIDGELLEIDDGPRRPDRVAPVDDRTRGAAAPVAPPLAPQVLVNLTCPHCRGRFHLPRAWWAKRLLAGKPPMPCRGCAPELYP